MKGAPNSAVLLLDEMRRLMQLRGENPFKIRAFENAIQVLDGREDLLERARSGTLTELSGIGKGISEVLTAYLLHGKTTARDALAAEIPEGLLELTRVPGLGSKKAEMLIQSLGIHTLGELEYACTENRLAGLKGFGEKTQAKILEGVRFLQKHQGQQRLEDARDVAARILEVLRAEQKRSDGVVLRVEETGALRRSLEILNRLEFLVETRSTADAALRNRLRASVELALNAMRLPVAVELHYAVPDAWGFEWVRTTGSEEHWAALGSPAYFPAASEEEFYSSVELPWVAPECRETGEEVGLARQGRFGPLPEKILGVFHNHTQDSDGTATLEQMVAGARERGFQYIGISDHSQAAYYARGLDPIRLKEQQKRVRKIQERFPEIRVFWGIESDILQDGSLDYEDEILESFDFVVASIHSRFQMDRAQMTERVLRALRNPYTTFLGHATGRLLLSRPGYELDMEAVIREASDRGVAIEINSNPLRLDIDWRWGPQLRESKTAVSVNPDAHSVSELGNVSYGLTVARKALLPAEQVLNTKSAKEVEQWLRKKN